MNNLDNPTSNLVGLLAIAPFCPTIEQLNKLPDTKEVEEYLSWYKPNYQIAINIFEGRNSHEIAADRWRKIRVGCMIAWGEFENEFEKKLDTLLIDRLSRVAYLKRLFDKLYRGPDYYRKQDVIAKYMRSSEFKALKGQISESLWNQLDEIGYAVWHGLALGKSVDMFIERALQIEGEPVRNGHYSEIEESKKSKDVLNPIFSQTPLTDESDFMPFTDDQPNTTKSQGSANKEVKQKRDTLEKCFEHTSKYVKIISLLAKHGYCDANTHIWKDRNAGFKGLVVELIKHLHTQGFYNKHGMPKSEEIVLIAKNTFDVDLGIDTVKGKKTGQIFKFIGPSTTF